MEWMETRAAPRAETIAFWKSIGTPQPKDLPLDDWGPWACIGCGQHDADYVEMYIGEAETWQWVRIPIFNNDDEDWDDVPVKPGQFVIWRHDHDCAGWCGPDPDPFEGLWRIVANPDEQR